MNMLISWPMGFSIFGVLGLSREISSFPISEKFCNLWFFWFFWDCLKEYAHFVAYGLWCF